MTDARAFTFRLMDLLSRERVVQAEFLVALAEFDGRRLWAELGHRSLFYFLHRELRLSTGAAYLRKVGADLVRAHPSILEALRDGRLCISALPEVAKVVTVENCAEVLPRFFHASRREARAVAAEVRPSDVIPIRTLVTALPTLTAAGAATRPSPPAAGAATSVGGSPDPAGQAAASAVARPFHPDETGPEPVGLGGDAAPARVTRAPSPPPAEATPLTAELRRLHVTVTKSFLGKLEKARDGLARVKPGASVEDTLEAALDALLAAQARSRGSTSRPQRRPRPSGDPRHVPVSVKRAVWERDCGCCQWVLDGGGICGSTRNLEFDHIRPLALGGLPTTENTRLLCRFHNLLAARRAFGDLMDRYVRPLGAREPVAPYGGGPELVPRAA